MIVLRSSSERLPHAAISLSALPQPTQRPVWPLTAHVLTHGLEMTGRSISQS